MYYQGAAAPSAKAPKEADEARIDMLDMRVGTIVSVTQHPNADALYLEEIDVGEDKPRQVCVCVCWGTGGGVAEE